MRGVSFGATVVNALEIPGVPGTFGVLAGVGATAGFCVLIVSGAFDVFGDAGVFSFAAGRDEIVSTPAVEEFATQLRAGSHLIIAGAKHELIMEQDRYRAQFWAAFDAFVPGTPVF